MALIRTSAVVTFGLAVAYYVLRALATRCSGLQCDQYIGPSLLVPFLILVGALVTGLLAIAGAMARQIRIWQVVLSGVTLLSVVGPVVSAGLLRDSPDVFVPVATVLALLSPLFALIYSFLAPAAS